MRRIGCCQHQFRWWVVSPGGKGYCRMCQHLAWKRRYRISSAVQTRLRVFLSSQAMLVWNEHHKRGPKHRRLAA